MLKNPKYLLLFIGFFGLLIVSAFVSPVWYDDAGHFMVAREAAVHGESCYPTLFTAEGTVECDPQSAFITMGPALTRPVAVAMGIFGTDMGVARAVMVLLSLLSLVAYAALGREVLDERKGWWATAIVLGNIQLLTYGAEFLGEVPMLGWLFLGMWMQLRWWKSGKGWQAALSGAAFLMAILTKEYIAGPLGTGMLAWLLVALLRESRRKAFHIGLQGVGIVAGLLLSYLLQTGSVEGVLDYFERRGSYGSEFFAFSLGESLRYLLWKPLIWLGTVAMVVKLYVRRDFSDVFLACIHLSMLAFFLVSAGYDRFGFQLIFIPAIYISEFVAFGWKKVAETRRLKLLWASAFVLGFVLFFSQRTLLVMGQRLLEPGSVNAQTRCMATKVAALGPVAVFTYDQQLVPFVAPGTVLGLPRVVPSNAKTCQQLDLQRFEYLVAGEYARTWYRACIPWKQMVAVDSCGTDAARLVLFRRR